MIRQSYPGGHDIRTGRPHPLPSLSVTPAPSDDRLPSAHDAASAAIMAALPTRTYHTGHDLAHAAGRSVCALRPIVRDLLATDQIHRTHVIRGTARVWLYSADPQALVGVTHIATDGSGSVISVRLAGQWWAS